MSETPEVPALSPSIEPTDEAARRSLVDLYRRDRASHLYALVDLDEPYWSRSRWWRRGDAAVGLVDLGDGETVVYAVSSDDPDGTLELLADLAAELPPGLVTGPLGVAQCMRAVGRRTRWDRTYRRYSWPLGRRPPKAPARVRRLGVEDLDAVEALHRTDPDAAFFVPAMLADGVFVGVFAEEFPGRLVAAGGTHVRTATEAAIGGILVDPRRRGRGLGREVTIGVLDALWVETDRPTDLAIGLNCTDRNEPAKRIYLELGFTPGLAYEECELA